LRAVSKVRRETKGDAMKSLVVKRSIVLNGHKTSISLEEEFWAALKIIAAEQQLTLSEVVASVDERRLSGNLSSAVRLFVLSCYRAAAHRVGPFALAGISDGR
jgi:predicted DNA-binding ribbon-helix-helix protein